MLFRDYRIVVAGEVGVLFNRSHPVLRDFAYPIEKLPTYQYDKNIIKSGQKMGFNTLQVYFNSWRIMHLYEYEKDVFRW